MRAKCLLKQQSQCCSRLARLGASWILVEAYFLMKRVSLLQHFIGRRGKVFLFNISLIFLISPITETILMN